MFQRVSEWLTEKSDRFVRGGAAQPTSSYYASDAAEQAYGGMTGAPEEAENAENAQQEPFGREADDEYGGRVPYKSQKDLQAEQQMQEAMRRQEAQRQAQQAAQQAAQPAGYQPQPQSFGAQPQAFGAQQGQQQPSNVVPFPGMMRGPDGNVYGHVEYIVLLRSRNECTKVIEYIKSNASVFLNMEFIANDSERQRCVDMLSGAAYTLGCALNKISPRGIYLISSPSVYVVIDPAMQKFASSPEAQGYTRQGYDSYGGYAQQPGYAPQPGGFTRRTQRGGYDQRPASGYEQREYQAGYAQRQPGYAERPANYAERQPEYAGYPRAEQQPAAAPAQPQPMMRQGFSSASPTSTFATQPKQVTPPFGMQSAFAGAATGTYPAARESEQTAHYATADFQR
ncbi:MAG: cell division protein SepF [Eubacteriales bacterium]|nr:cell division protein SepF [Eubacteriales bacterium]